MVAYILSHVHNGKVHYYCIDESIVDWIYHRAVKRIPYELIKLLVRRNTTEGTNHSNEHLRSICQTVYSHYRDKAHSIVQVYSYFDTRAAVINYARRNSITIMGESTI